MNLIDILKPLRSHAGQVRTAGLDDATAKRLWEVTEQLTGVRFAELDK